MKLIKLKLKALYERAKKLKFYEEILKDFIYKRNKRNVI